MMREIALLALLGLAACTTAPTPTPYGNFAGTRAGFDEKMAADTVKQLLVLYPPATTQFNLRQATPDAFGASLVSGLRDKGYAVSEGKLEQTAQQARPSNPAGQEKTAGMQQPAGLDLRYVLDQPVSLNLYRVTVLVGNQSLTRAYVEQNAALLPAGSWVRRE
jgi:type IV secretion system protein TrbH